MRDYIITLFIVTAITLSSGSATAGIYKYRDANGKIVYGDKPVVGAKKLKIRLRPTPEPEDEEESEDDSDADGSETDEAGEVTSYKSLELLNPTNDKVISDRSGSVQVILMPTPRLSSNHKLVINVDGKDISRGRHTNLNLSQMPRGTHTVSGRILDANGTELISSPTASFHVKRPTADEELAYQ